jgi:hypothetical protein
MREIYSKADLVLSWLGHGIDEIDQAFDILQTIVKETRELGNRPAGVEWLKNYPSWCVEFETDKACLDSIRTFFELPYWQRVWIFQELVLGTRILFVHGSTNMTYEDLYRANHWIFFTRQSIDHGKIQKPDFLDTYIWLRLSSHYFHVVPILRVGLYKNRDAVHDPYVMFYICSALQATDPRDHIYGLLGLGDFEIVPDYRKDFSSVLQDLVHAWMRNSKKLDYLLYAGIGTFDRGSFGSLPSWAPNFSLVSQRQRIELMFFQSGHADQGVFAAATKAPTLIDSVLQVSALLGPAVVKVYETFPQETWFDGRMYQFAEDYVRHAPSQKRGVHPLKAIFDVIRSMVNELDPVASGDPTVRLAIGVLMILVAPPEVLPIVESFAQLGVPFDDNFANTFFNVFLPGQSFEKEGFLDKFGSQEYTDRGLKTVKFMSEATLANFRFTEMEGGYLGMAPKFSRPGDVVAILKGCKVPLILRKHKDHYIIIGTSSIPGLMEGEAKELCESGRARFEDIQIR